MAVPYRISCRVALAGLPFAFGLLLLTMVGEVARENADIGRWLPFLFGTTMQPVDLVKLCLALALPYWIDTHPESTQKFRGGFLTLLLAPGLAVLVLALQPNFGSALALGMMCLSIFWLAGVKKRYLFTLSVVAGLLCWLGYLHVGKVHERVLAWLAVLLREQGQHSAYAYQSFQALVGLGSGGLTGVGPGASTMKFLFLPEGHTDFIFAILGEELGFLGAGTLVVLLGLWLARAMKIAYRSADGLAYLVALGVGAMIFSYAAINLAMVVALMPVAGLPLPFLSYGGSALVTNMVAVGVLLNVSRTVQGQRRPADRWMGVGR
jgi:cell division protein FtsW